MYAKLYIVHTSKQRKNPFTCRSIENCQKDENLGSFLQVVAKYKQNGKKTQTTYVVLVYETVPQKNKQFINKIYQFIKNSLNSWLGVLLNKILVKT